MNKKTFITSGLAALLTFGGLTGCGDGVDQDNGVSDGKQKDAVDKDTQQEAQGSLDEAKDDLKEIGENVEDALKEEGVGDGVDQDNGASDGEKKDAVDSTNP
jgi:hypothetical protein